MPTNNGLANYTFPGDSLTLNTNTEIRFKRAQNASVIAGNFPGTNGNPGLILNGGLLNAGDSSIFPVTGNVGVVSQSYICPGNNVGGGTRRHRARVHDFCESQRLEGHARSLGGLTTNSANTISGTNNTFTGAWIVKAGLLRGSTTNSLGTNSITMDPGFVLPVDAADFANNITDVHGPAVLDVLYDIFSYGTLTLTNGGSMRLHQNCNFGAVVIEGTSLSLGTHYYADLTNQFPASFAPGGSGSIAVGTNRVILPTIVTQPSAAGAFRRPDRPFHGRVDRGRDHCHSCGKRTGPISLMAGIFSVPRIRS